MTMCRYNVSWQNWPGAPGVSTFFTDPSAGQPDPAPIRTFFDAIKAYLPTGMTITVPSSGDLIEESTGALSGSWSVTPVPTVITCTGSGGYAGNAGGVIHWLSTEVVNGRRVRGRTFLVPLIGGVFETNGSPNSTYLGALNTAATAFLASSTWHPVVWARPFAGTPQDPVTRVGSKHPVTSFRIPDLAISLRSRRI